MHMRPLWIQSWLIKSGKVPYLDKWDLNDFEFIHQIGQKLCQIQWLNRAISYSDLCFRLLFECQTFLSEGHLKVRPS